MRRFGSLTARLTITTVLLVAIICVLLGTATTWAMRSHLTDQLDEKVSSSLRRADGPPEQQRPDRGPEDDQLDLRDVGNQGPGTLIAFPDSNSGVVLTDEAGEGDQLSEKALSRISDIPADGEVHSLSVPGHGVYRVMAVDTDRGRLVTGLPTSDVEDSVQSLIWLEAGLTLLAMLAAGAIGVTVVRRQLTPLRQVADTAHRVAELPLAEGEISLDERVPPELADQPDEVGQMGSALNALLDHVETSLELRHRSEQQVRQFVADASHELRTPLATIQGYAELTRLQPDDPERSAVAWAKVTAESARMAALVEDLLLLARLDSGRPLESEPVDLTRLLLEAVSDVRVVAPDHSWRLSLPDQPVEVRGDALRLHQVVTNLLGNARKYTPPGSTVTVTAYDDGFEVADDGPGFDPGLAPRAFERFVRGDVARTRDADSGAGLGLSLVQAIVEAHGGRVRLTSAPGDTRIRVTLPRAS